VDEKIEPVCIRIAFDHCQELAFVKRHQFLNSRAEQI
jgi:hypothetical protein